MGFLPRVQFCQKMRVFSSVFPQHCGTFTYLPGFAQLSSNVSQTCFALQILGKVIVKPEWLLKWVEKFRQKIHPLFPLPHLSPPWPFPPPQKKAFYFLQNQEVGNSSSPCVSSYIFFTKSAIEYHYNDTTVCRKRFPGQLSFLKSKSLASSIADK